MNRLRVITGSPRNRKILIVLLGAIVAIVGTVVTDWQRSKVADQIAKDQATLTDLRYWSAHASDNAISAARSRTNADLFQAVSDPRSGPNAEYGQTVAAYQYTRFALVDVRNRVEKNVTRDAAEATIVARAEQSLKSKDPTARASGTNAATDCGALRRLAVPPETPAGDNANVGRAVDDVGTLYGCWSDQLIAQEVALTKKISDESGHIGLLTSIATYLQLAGILIALLKDVAD
jgi:hypothetical protein